jgi:hypothetical protein
MQVEQPQHACPERQQAAFANPQLILQVPATHPRLELQVVPLQQSWSRAPHWQRPPTQPMLPPHGVPPPQQA